MSKTYLSKEKKKTNVKEYSKKGYSKIDPKLCPLENFNKQNQKLKGKGGEKRRST